VSVPPRGISSSIPNAIPATPPVEQRSREVIYLKPGKDSVINKSGAVR
jgi:hypothetical protein